MGEIQVTQNEIFGKYGIIVKTLLQRVYREENGLFGLVDTYLPEKGEKGGIHQDRGKSSIA
ncbi:MAG: hypothetical protein ACYCPR_06035 [Thermoplasmataceae archaeon]